MWIDASERAIDPLHLRRTSDVRPGYGPTMFQRADKSSSVMGPPEPGTARFSRCTRSFSGHRFGHSFARTECEQAFANATKIAEFSRIVRRRTSFGTRGSQVQILPLRPALSLISNSHRHRLRHRFVPPLTTKLTNP